MAQTRSSGFDRFNDALKSLDEQLQDLRERFDHQRRKVERDFGWAVVAARFEAAYDRAMIRP